MSLEFFPEHERHMGLLLWDTVDDDMAPRANNRPFEPHALNKTLQTLPETAYDTLL